VISCRRETRLRLHAPERRAFADPDPSPRSFALSWFFFFISLAVYVADTYTLIALLASNRWSGQILQSEAAQGDTKSSNVLEVPFNIGELGLLVEARN
jgi:hypothetical protein